MEELGEDEIKILFGKNLAELRKAQGFTQEGLALETGIARSYLSGIERGKRNVALINIWRLAQALNIRPSALLDFRPN